MLHSRRIGGGPTRDTRISRILQGCYISESGDSARGKMLAEIGAGLGSLKAAMDIAKGLTAANTQAAINEVKIGLQTHILAAQEALFAAQATQTAAADRIRDLEKQIAEGKNWKSEMDRYQLKAIDSGAFAYMLKPGMEDGEPPHWLCTNCFDKGRKSYLQSKGQSAAGGLGRGSQQKWSCNSCGGDVSVYYTRKPSVPWEPKPVDD